MLALDVPSRRQYLRRRPAVSDNRARAREPLKEMDANRQTLQTDTNPIPTNREGANLGFKPEIGVLTPFTCFRSTFRTEVADTEDAHAPEFADDTSVSPMRVLAAEPQDQGAQR